MGFREVRVYDGDFPTFDQMLAGGHQAAFPKERWLPEVHSGEFAVRYKDFKTGLARNPAGEHVKSSEICRIFSSLEEARANSKEVVKAHWTIRCLVHDHTGAVVGAISNNKEVNKYALVAYAGILLWLAIFAVVGMGCIWVIFELALAVVGPFPAVHERLSSFGWVGWTTYAIAGILAGILVWYLRIQYRANRVADRMRGNLNSVISPEDKKRFEELNTLHGSEDPAERERFLSLAKEYQQKVNEALKK
jgi:hypothetical protein